MHPEVQWANISGSELQEASSAPDLWTEGPTVGYLPRPYAERLADLLAHHTSTPERVWFGVWDGWSGLGDPESRAPLRRSYRPRNPRALGRPGWLLGAFRPRPRPREPLPAPIFRLPNRGYYLFRGPLGAITDSFDVPSFPVPANLCWPEDRAWCVATDIDLAWTYLGGSEACVTSVLADPAIEALPAEIGHRITHDSDQINRPPRSSGLGS